MRYERKCLRTLTAFPHTFSTFHPQSRCLFKDYKTGLQNLFCKPCLDSLVPHSIVEERLYKRKEQA